MKQCLFYCVITAFPALSQPMVWLSEWDPQQNKTVTIDEQTRNLILSQLSSPDFITEQTNSQRALRRLQNEDTVCVGDRVNTTERQTYSIASQLPQVVVPGLKLYVSQSFLDSHNLAPHTLSKMTLHALFEAYPRLRLGAVSGRAYGAEIDNVLSAPQWQDNLWWRSSSDMGEGVIEMLLSNRVDAVFEYPPLFDKIAGKQMLSSTVSAVSLAGIPRYGVGYVLCSRSEEGKNAIAAISKAMVQVTQTPAYLSAHLSNLSPYLHKEMIEIYNEVYGTHFLFE